MTDKEPLEILVEQLFPRRWKYPVNSMVPALTETPQGRRLALLAVVDEKTVEILENDKENREVISTAYLEENRYGISRDLILSFQLECTGGAVAFETSVPGDEQKGQNLMLEVLKSPGELGLFVVDRQREPVKVLKVNWDPEPVDDVLKTLEEMNNGNS